MTAQEERGEALFQTLIATAVDGIVVIDEDGLVEIYNVACERLFQYPAAEVTGRNVSMLMPEPYSSEHDGYLERYKRTGERRIIGIGREVVGRRRDGSTFPMYLSVGEGRLDGRRIFVGILHDLSAKKEAAARHEGTLRELALIVEHSEDAIITKNLEGLVTSWNPAAERIFGYSAAEMIGQPLTTVFPEELIAEEARILAQLRAGKSIRHYETVRVRKDGARIDVSLSASPLRDSSGTVIGASKIARDITEKKAAEAKLRDMQAEMAHVSRLTSMGQLSSALAHELNQPLTATTNYLNTARTLLENAEDPRIAKADQALEKGVAQIQRAGQIIRRLREFVEKRKVSRALADINEVVQEAVTLGLVASSDVNIRLRADLVPNLPRILMDRVQIQQVMVNLIRNAVEAMQGSKRKEMAIATTASDGYVRVAVADTGPGVSPELAERLFQPFVTTKSTGMGIGLMICRSIVEAHGGSLSLAARQGGGAIFQFQLPIDAEKTDDDE
ncbi:MAG TPA: PAS domain S-box protein [Rhizomicrobium sp.]|nr:PAS domain S-box protein [Rhizomicrobium sp.]